MLTINNVYKKFGKNVIFKDLNLHFTNNRIYRIVGNNGRGKSTLLKMICGIEKIDQGSIVWGDINYYKQSGFIFDHPLYIEDLSFKDNLLYLSKINKLDSLYTDKRISYLSKLFDLPLDEIPIKLYSSGMKKKVEIAMSILNEPKYLLWDEPFNNLDKNSIEIINQEVLSKNISIILITHNEEYILNEFQDILI